MARFAKTILTAAVHQSPEGPVVATPARIRHWAKQQAAMRAAGLKTPVCWGHHLSSVPYYPDDQRFDQQQFLGARFNAGYFETLTPRDGATALEAEFNVPGAELDADGNLVSWVRDPKDGREYKAAIAEVSAAITPLFIDGKGRAWRDIISHIALVPYPVVGHQDGFRSLATKTPDGTVFLSLGVASGFRFLGTSNMAATDTIAPSAVEDDIEVEGEQLADLDGDGDVDQRDADIQKLIELIGKVCNVHVPAAENPQQFIEHLTVVLQHMDSAANGAAGEMPPLQGGTENAPVVAENTPAMMSLLRESPEAKRLHEEAKRLAETNRKLLAEKQARYRAALTTKLAKARKVVPAAVIDKVNLRPTTVCLSLSRTTADAIEPKQFTVNQVLDLLIEAGNSQPGGKLTQTLSTAKAIANPLKVAKRAGKVSDQESTAAAEKLMGAKYRPFGHKTDE